MAEHVLFCAKCGEEKAWVINGPNICARCGARRFSSEKPIIEDPQWDLSVNDRTFLKRLKIAPY